MAATSAPHLMLCDCGGSFRPDPGAVESATGMSCPKVYTSLCRAQAGHARRALASDGEVVIACAQEAETFAELADAIEDAARLTCVDIRDRAGWSDEASGPKQAALLAAARLSRPPVQLMDVESAGLCLVLGASDVAIPAAERLAGILTPTALVTDRAEIVDLPSGVDVATGRVSTATGALGRFSLTVDRFAALEPAGRGALGFGAPVDGAETACDVILDLTGGAPLFPAHHKRDGYVRADPRDPLAVERAIFEASQLSGTFEKPLHIRFTESLCAHSRARQTGCTRCLNVCPTGAIVPGPEDSVILDPNVCAGCGACHAVCPSGAALSDDPPVEALFRQMRVMAEAYRMAGGKAPRLLVHDAEHGLQMIRLAARHGRGLPGDVIPLEIPSVSAFGHAEQLVALALGYTEVSILAGPRTDKGVTEAEIALSDAITAGVGVAPGRLRILDPADPDALSDTLYAARPAAIPLEPILASGGRRDSVRLAARALSGDALPDTPVPLPAGAPYGAVIVNEDACTLCLSCAGLCPTGALLDNPDRPELSFREEACIQCGICATVCPEDAIRLEPRLDLSDAVLRPQVKKAEEPFECIECGKPFGVRSTVEKIVEKLQNRHAMFTNSDNVKLIQMCDDCRVKVQFRSTNNPFAAGERPRVRTTDDYLAERKINGDSEP